MQREALHRQALDALSHLAYYCEGRVEYDLALDYARRQVELEPWREVAHRQWMRALALSGQRSAALAQYDTCRQILREELGVEPEGETTALYERIRDGEELRPVFAVPPHNLPAQLIPFIGREAYLDEIAERLGDPDCRLLTLVGPGGSGKTRLAQEAALALVSQGEANRFADGVFFVSLAPLRSAETIVTAIAQAIGFGFYDGAQDPRWQLLDYLRQKRMLLVLDNFEHLLEDAGLAVEMLKAAPDVKVVTTSRVALSVPGECLCPLPGMQVPPLPAPDEDSVPGCASERAARPGHSLAPGWEQEVARYSAVRLFLDSARRVEPGFALSAGNAADVARICYLVAGMPLGILLAAAWVRMLAPAEIAGRLSREGGGGLDFLAGDLRGVPERQRSMRAVFDHSWSLLSAPEQETLAQLSVFRGGFTQDAAQALAGAGLRMLLGFVSRSLVHRAPDGRYEMHELLRQYAEEKLAAMPGEWERTSDLHCTYYAGFLHRREDDVVKGQMREVMREIDNIRAAWHWAASRGKAQGILQFSLSMMVVYTSNEWLREGEAMFGTAADNLRLERAGEGTETREVALGVVLGLQGFFLCRVSPDETERAIQLAREGLALVRKHGVGPHGPGAGCGAGCISTAPSREHGGDQGESAAAPGGPASRALLCPLRSGGGARARARPGGDDGATACRVARVA